jgi:N-acyl-phosphatidylethanolamine-hydrolysing phospholipase D
LTGGVRPPHHGPDGRFRNPWPAVRPHGAADLLRWGIQRAVQGTPADPDPQVFTRAPAALPADLGPRDLAVTWIGHATTLLQVAGRNVLTDPMFGDRASPTSLAGPRRWVPPGVPLAALPPVHAVLLSHSHYDHLDAPSVRAIAAGWPEARWHVPLRLGPVVRGMGAARVTEYDWWEQGTEGPLTLTATPAQHFSARTPFDRNRTLWCGWAVSTPDRRVFFAGDTGHHPVFGEIARRLGPFDAALLPVGAYEPRWFMRPIHMTPEEAVQAFGELQPAEADRGVLVPIHWGTFKLTDEPMDEPPRRTRAAWEASGRAADRLWLLRHGETRVLRA